MTLSDGTVVQQDVSPVELCSDMHIKNLLRVVAKQFADGRGIQVWVLLQFPNVEA